MPSAEISEGVNINNLSPGCLVEVETISRRYHVECLGGHTMRISGHPDFCPNPVEAELQGSVDREGMYESGFITPGKQLVFVLARDRFVTTTRVLSVHVDEPDRVH